MSDAVLLRRKVALRFLALRAMRAAPRLILACLRFLRRLAAMTGLRVEHALMDAVAA